MYFDRHHSETYYKLEKELNSNDPSLKNIGKIISVDIGLSATILKQINSPYWGLSNFVKDIEQAVHLLGTYEIKAITISNHMFSLFTADHESLLSLNDIEDNSLLTARFSKEIMRILEGNKSETDHAFVSGLLLDIGKLILFNNFPKTYEVVIKTWNKRDNCKLRAVELEIMGVTHAEIGAYLLKVWEMPKTVIDSVSLHHTLLLMLNI